MRPEWHKCQNCYFTLSDSDNCLWCHYDTVPLATVDNSFCSRWMCGRCNGYWDDGVSHSDCMFVEIDME